MKIRYLFVGLFCTILMLGGAAVWMTKASSSYSESSALWHAQFGDLSGQIRRIKQPVERPLVVNFWATWCTPCQEELMDLADLATRFKDSADFVGIAVDNTLNVQAFLAKHSINYPTYLGQADVLALMQSEGNTVGGVPFTVVYAKGGRKVKAISGKIQKETLAALLLNLTEPLV